MSEPLLKGAWDLHVHCSPDVVPRAQDVFDLAAAAHASGMAGIGLKDHTTSTVGRCHVLNRMYEHGPRFLSSIALNPPVGGFNPAAVESALRSGVDIVYLPTYSAAHHIRVLGKETTPVPHPSGGAVSLEVCDGSGEVLPVVRDIVRLIAEYDAVLATGHISPAESLSVLSLAAEAGVKRLVVTHASQSVPDMTVEDQLRAVEFGALIEHCLLAVTECCPGTIPLEAMAQQIRDVGIEHIFLSSDFGQPENGPPIAAFGKHIRRLKQLGFADSELGKMLCENPGELVSNRRKRPE